MATQYTSQLTHSEGIANGTKLFRIAKPEGFEYRAGQTIDLALTGSTASPLVHTFSLVSAPHEASLSVATRMRDSEYKKILGGLSAGDEVSFEGPYGSFMLHANESRPAVFLVGGIGITPFMSMISDAIERKLPHELYLFYSNRRPEDSAFLNELTECAQKHPKLHFVPTMTDMKDSESDWSGEQGYINWDMIKKHLADPLLAIFYMAGPEKMVNAMRTMLNENGISEDDIRFEEFPGY